MYRTELDTLLGEYYDQKEEAGIADLSIIYRLAQQGINVSALPEERYNNRQSDFDPDGWFNRGV